MRATLNAELNVVSEKELRQTHYEERAHRRALKGELLEAITQATNAIIGFFSIRATSESNTTAQPTQPTQSDTATPPGA